MDGDRAGTGAQAAGSFDVGEGVVGGVLLVEGGGGTEGDAPGEAAETVMASFWPDCYSESSLLLWESVKDMYGSQNNSVRIFQLKKSVASLKQGDHSYVQHLGSMKSMWNELDMYRPHTTDSTVLLKRADEDKVFQLLASLGAEYEDLRSHLLMTQELPSFTSVCHAVQIEETRKRVMNVEPKSNSEARVFTTNHKATGDKPKFDREGRMIKDGKGGVTPKAFHSACSSTDGMANFSTNHVSLINEFVVFLQKKQGSTEPDEMTPENPTAMLGKFAGFLDDSENTSKGNIPGIINAISTALNANVTHDFWIIDSSATDHITNKPSSFHNFQRTIDLIHVSIANGKEEPILGNGKIRLLSEHTDSTALYVPSFPFQLLSIGKITKTLDRLAIFSPHTVVFQDRVTQKKIGEGFFLNGLYYLSKESNFSKSSVST
ncbi:uncharacterized protein [Malus domestica]|uniref:uncharacterized protein n=1 Tax=Malus domestica TaxID=3750 RepID=UPI003975BDE3